MQYVLLAAAILGEVIATSALKASDGFTRLGPSVVAIAAYGIAFYFLSLTLRTIPVGIAYAVWSGAGIVLITSAGWLVFGQRIDLWGGVGLGLIVAGVFVVNFLSSAAVH